MQILTLEHGHWNFFCPTTGQAVYKEDEAGINAESFRGCWSGDFPSEPIDLAPELQTAWESYAATIEEDGDASFDVPAFLKGLDLPGWVAFEVNSFGMACGPVWTTSWTVLDLTGKD
jgi:hypothetical protein